jgi:hypothetical protein
MPLTARQIIFAGALLCLSDAASGTTLVSNRAVYEVALAHTAGNTVLAAHGRMAIAFRDTCDGWSTEQRLIADLSNPNGKVTRTDFFVSAWESKDGRTMRFDVATTQNGKAQSRNRGSALLAADGSGKAQLLQGTTATVALPRATQFPTDQTLAILRAVQSGIHSVKHVVFQGGDASDVEYSVARIGVGPTDAARPSRSVDPTGLLAHARSWPVLISFYPLQGRSEAADYSIATRLYDNGISGSMTLIYPDYTLKATLVHLDTLPPRAC